MSGFVTPFGKSFRLYSAEKGGILTTSSIAAGRLPVLGDAPYALYQKRGTFMAFFRHLLPLLTGAALGCAATLLAQRYAQQGEPEHIVGPEAFDDAAEP